MHISTFGDGDYTPDDTLPTELDSTHFVSGVGLAWMRQTNEDRDIVSYFDEWSTIIDELSVRPVSSPTFLDLLPSFDAAVADGTLVGDGRGKSAKGRLKALRNKIEAAVALIEAGFVEEGCDQLLDAYNRCDGESPPGFVSGESADDLADMIKEVLLDLCAE